MKDKELEKFLIWEYENLGYGYGTGEIPIIVAMRTFFDSLKDHRSYNHETLEVKLGKRTTWLLINLFSKTRITEYGTSTRNAWLTDFGEIIRRVFLKYSNDELYIEIMKPGILKLIKILSYRNE